jgi:dihydroorotate dehydrogenase (NAD+) catalytic subunit
MIQLGNLQLKTPVCVAAGPLGFGGEFQDWANCGAFFTKTLTVEPTPGFINKVGLDNPGINAFIQDILPGLKQKGCPIIASVLASNDASKTVKMVSKLDGLVDGVELNISCPNTEDKHGYSYYEVKTTLNFVRQVTDMFVSVKLPYCDNIVELAAACKHGGADAVTAINTIPVLTWEGKGYDSPVTGGLSGPAIRPIALKCVYEIRQKVDIPVIGVGGITNWREAASFMAAGASAVAVGSALLVDANTISKISTGLSS